VNKFRQKNIKNDFTILFDQLKKKKWPKKEEALLVKAFAEIGPNFEQI
jgi:hypothetical protein